MLSLRSSTLLMSTMKLNYGAPIKILSVKCSKCLRATYMVLFFSKFQTAYKVPIHKKTTDYEAFLGFMDGKALKTILTDQTMCLKEAIAMEMPVTIHALCIWMIVLKFPSWFNAVLAERYNEWKDEYYRLYNLESIEDFELGWRDMVNSFGLHTNRRIANLFALRTQWALPYLRSYFFARMTTTGHSKAINAFIQRFLSAQTRLEHFIKQVCVLGFVWGYIFVFWYARSTPCSF